MTTEQTFEVDEIIYKAFEQCFLLNNLSLMQITPPLWQKVKKN